MISLQRTVLATVFIICAYWLLGVVSSVTTLKPWDINLVWLPAGLAAGALLGWGWRCLPGVVLGAALTRLLVLDEGLAMVLVKALNPMLGAVAVLWLNRGRFGCMAPAAGTAHDVLDRVGPAQLLRFVGTLGAGAAINAAFGTYTVCFMSGDFGEDCASLIMAWFTGDFFGMLLLAPLILRFAETRSGCAGFGDWLRPVALSLMALGALSFVLHEAIERSATASRFVTTEHLQSYISFGVLTTSCIAGLLLLWQAHSQTQQQRLRRHSEAVERHSLQRFRALAELGADWMWETDAEGRWIWFAGERFLPWGAASVENMGKKRLDILRERHDLTAEPWRSHIATLERHEPFTNFVYSRKLADGTEVWLRMSGAPRYEDGVFAGYRAVVTDITEEVRARERIRQLESRISAIVANGSVVLYTCRADGDFGATFVSENVRVQTGYAAEQFTADPGFWAARIHPDDVEGVFKGLSGLFERGRHVHEYRFRCSDDTYRWMRDELCLVRDAGGLPLELAGAWIDIEARKQMESALRQSERRYRSVFDHATQAMLVVRDGAILLCNRYAEQQLGASLLERLAAEVAAPHPGISPDESRTYQLAQPGRPERWVQAHAVPIDWDDGPARLIFAVDITQRRHEEEQLRQSQKLEAIGQLTGGLAHDFNNLLGIVVGNLDLIGPQLPPEPRLRARHGAALQAALRGAEVTNSLLAVARRQPLESETHNVNELLEEMLPLLRASVGSAVELRVALSADGPHARLDAAGLSNAVLNLVINARDALAERKESRLVTLSTRVEELAAHPPLALTPGSYVVLEVADNGCGMSAATRAHAFDPFFTTKQRGQGTGLGLSMVHGYAEQLGGTATLDSVEGVGTTVRIYLPYQAASGQQKNPPAVPAGGQADEADVRLRVLVVDDEAGLCEVACEWLESLGYNVTGVHSPRQALESLEAERYDVLFTDVVMPGGMDGLDLARECIRRQPGIRVLLTSGYAQSLLEASDLPGIVLSKPYRKNDLARALQQVCAAPL